MVKSKRKIGWDKEALDHFKESILYIKKLSPKNSEKVKKDILKKINKLVDKPEIYPPDKYKSDNNGNYYRAFELHRFRISYLVKDEMIIIARFQHTSQEPFNY